jgi:hypothetical protein
MAPPAPHELSGWLHTARELTGRSEGTMPGADVVRSACSALVGPQVRVHHLLPIQEQKWID